MFWKAAVHPWESGKIEPRIELGPYVDPLRLWLHGAAEFPKHMYLVIQLTTPERAHAGLLYPYEADPHVFYAYTSGLLFMLHVGKSVISGAPVLCAWNRPEHPILISEVLIDKFENNTREQFQGARQTASFLRVMDRIEKEKGTKFMCS